MATSGTYTNSSIENADLIADAFERIGKDPDSIVTKHIDSALRSLFFLMSEWAARGVKEWKVEKFTFAASNGFTTGASSLTLAARVIRIVTMVHRHDNVDTPVKLIGRQDYEYLVNKGQAGNRPDRAFLDRQRAAPILYFWPVLDNNTDSLIITAFVYMQDIGELSDNPEIPLFWQEALVSGLAAKLAEKYAPERLSEKITLANNAFKLARGEDRDPAPTKLRVRFRGGRR
jgi:hypothetical protein